ncbi:shieldin complex subunit 2 isoform X2 [Cavia porcellus]|uniref:shieldin complex subunit 2 isoform X2 n=1 Tax=Cavia porcellus TaxID=10141 RepID=UPI000C87A5B9|nr:protein FAM35A isoform X2 [Cavia porcellus]
MSGRSQVHIFWGAPVCPLKMTGFQGAASLTSTADRWEKMHLLCDGRALAVPEESHPPGTLKEHGGPKGAGAPGPGSSVQRRPGFLHSASETQHGEAQKGLSSGLSAVPCSSVQIRGPKDGAQRSPNEREHQQLQCESNITGGRPENGSDTRDQNVQAESCHLGLRCAAGPDVASSAGHSSPGPAAVETKCVPAEFREEQSPHPESLSSAALEEPGPAGAGRRAGISADTEFLSVMTCSQLAFLAQRQAQRQKCRNAGSVSVEAAPRAGPAEGGMAEDSLVQPNGEFAEGDESAQAQAHSLELFSPARSETESSHIRGDPGKGLKGGAGSQELFDCEEGLAASEIRIELCSSGILCSQPDAIRRTPAGRSTPSTPNSGLSEALPEVTPISQKMKPCSKARDSARAECQRVMPEFKGIKKPSLIKRCDSRSHKYNCLVMVLTPCHVKEVNVKSGPNAGSTVPLATVTVVDQSEMKKQVVLWRTTAFWALTVFPGDIVFLTDVTVREDPWVGDTVLQSTFTSQLLNLGNYSSVLPEEYSSIVSTAVLRDLLAYVSSKHSYLRGLPQRWPRRGSRTEFAELARLQPDTLVHAVLRVVDVAVLTGSIWEFKYLYVQRNCLLESLELHTTPWSSCECLFDDDIRAVAFKSKFQERAPSFTRTSDLATHLTEKCSGVVLIEARIVELVLPVGAAQEVRLNAHSSLEHILSWLPSMTYAGCAGCGAELHTDENKIYRQCLRCLPLSGKKTYYRPAFMTVVDRSHVARIHVGSALMEKILLHIAPDWLGRAVVPTSEVTYGMVAADLLHSLLADGAEPSVLTLESRFVLDENSCPLQQDLSLLDFHPPGGALPESRPKVVADRPGCALK